MRIPDRRAAIAGERYTWRGESLTVQPTSPGDEGYWVCLTCEEAFANNLQKEFHCALPRPRRSALRPGGAQATGERARHVLAWFSYATNQVEAP